MEYAGQTSKSLFCLLTRLKADFCYTVVLY